MDPSNILKTLEKSRAGDFNDWNNILKNITPKNSDLKDLIESLIARSASFEQNEAYQLINRLLGIYEECLKEDVRDISLLNDLIVVLALNFQNICSTVIDFTSKSLIFMNNNQSNLGNLILSIFESIPLVENAFIDKLVKYMPTWIKPADVICASLENVYGFIFSADIYPHLSDESLRRLFSCLTKLLTDLDINNQTKKIATNIPSIDRSKPFLEFIRGQSQEFLSDPMNKCGLVGYFIIEKLKSLSSNSKTFYRGIKIHFDIFFENPLCPDGSPLISVTLFIMVVLWPKFFIICIDVLLKELKNEKSDPLYLSLLADLLCHSNCHLDLVIECLRSLSLFLTRPSKNQSKYYYSVACAFFSVLLVKHSQLLESSIYFRAVSKLGISKIILSSQDPLKILPHNFRKLLKKVLSSYNLHPFASDEDDILNQDINLDSILSDCKIIKFELSSLQYPYVVETLKPFLFSFKLSKRIDKTSNIKKVSFAKGGIKRSSSVAFDLSRLSGVN